MAESASTDNVIRIQALVRGRLVRRKLEEVRKNFELIAAELEGDLQVRWPFRHFGPPLITRKGEDIPQNPFLSRDVYEPELTSEETAREYENTVTSTSSCVARLPGLLSEGATEQEKVEQRKGDVSAGNCDGSETENSLESTPKSRVSQAIPTTPEDLQTARVHNRRARNLSMSDTWMTDRSFDPVESPCEVPLPHTTDSRELSEMQDRLALELLWTRQAIESRKNYLQLRRASGPNAEKRP